MNAQTGVLSASEIGQYTYCAMSWYLQKCGYTPQSPKIEQGALLHKSLGEGIDAMNYAYKRSRRYGAIGILLCFVAVLCIVFGVML